MYYIDGIAIVDITSDFMHRLVYADQNGRIRMIQGGFVDTILSGITGGFGKCFKINPAKDTLCVVTEHFEVAQINLKANNFAIESRLQIPGNMAHLSDWTMDYQHTLVYLLMNNGLIIIGNMKSKALYRIDIDHKYFIKLSSEEKNFTTVEVNFDNSLLAISGVSDFKTHKANILLMYKVQIDSKNEASLTYLTETTHENSWEGSKQT